MVIYGSSIEDVKVNGNIHSAFLAEFKIALYVISTNFGG